ncbi:flavin reductase family protein [Rhodococcus koreensis]
MENTDTTAIGIDPMDLRNAFAAFPSGVVAIAAIDNGRPAGMAASSFTSVSMDPPLVSICAAKSSTTWPKLRQMPRLGLSVLSAEQGSHCRALASKLTADNRFAEVDWQASPEGAVFVEGAALWIECSLFAELEAGDHEIVLLQIHSMTPHPEVEPLVFHGSRFRKLTVEPAI